MTNPTAPGGDLKLFGPEMSADPYPIYHRLRSTHPVFRFAPMNLWIVTSYEAINGILRNPHFSSDRYPRMQQQLAKRGLDGLIQENMRSLIHMDAPDHTRLRGLVSKAFTHRSVEAMEGRIQQLVDELIDTVHDRGQMDLIEHLAYPLPVMVIAEMLGVPAEDRALFKKWSDDIAPILSGDPGLPEPVLRRVMEARGEFREYLRAVVERRRRDPGDDLLSALIRAEEEGGRLSEDELYSTVVLLLIAGHETTTNLIGNGMNALLRHPSEQRRVWDDDALIPSAVEEMLRFDSPVQLTSRLAKSDQVVLDVKISAGEWLFLFTGAANRDPAQFTDPDRFDVGRTPNHHIAFGAGPHFCLGAPLARLEAQIAVRTLRRRCPNIRLSGETPAYRDNFNLRGLTTLPVSF